MTKQTPGENLRFIVIDNDSVQESTLLVKQVCLPFVWEKKGQDKRMIPLVMLQMEGEDGKEFVLSSWGSRKVGTRQRNQSERDLRRVVFDWYLLMVLHSLPPSYYGIKIRLSMWVIMTLDHVLWSFLYIPVLFANEGTIFLFNSTLASFSIRMNCLLPHNFISGRKDS